MEHATRVSIQQDVGGGLKAKRVNGHGRGILATFVHKPDLAMEKICLSKKMPPVH